MINLESIRHLPKKKMLKELGFQNNTLCITDRQVDDEILIMKNLIFTSIKNTGKISLECKQKMKEVSIKLAILRIKYVNELNR